MSFFNWLFGRNTKKPRSPLTSKLTPPAKPTAPSQAPQKDSPEVWAERLKAQKDYAALAAGVDYPPPFSQHSYARARSAEAILEQAGVEAVDAILQHITLCGRCNRDLARLLVKIGDPRATGVLKAHLLRGAFKYDGDLGGLERQIEKFLLKVDGGFQDELNAIRAAKEAAEDAELDADLAKASTKGARLNDYLSLVLFEPSNKIAFDSLRAAIGRGKTFAFNAPHQIALIQGEPPEPELYYLIKGDFIAILMHLPSVRSSAVGRRLKAWLAEVVGEGKLKAHVFADNKYAFWSAAHTARISKRPMSDPRSRLSDGLQYMADQYRVLEIIDNLDNLGDFWRSARQTRPSPKEEEQAPRPSQQVLTKPPSAAQARTEPGTALPSGSDKRPERELRNVLAIRSRRDNTPPLARAA